MKKRVLSVLAVLVFMITASLTIEAIPVRGDVAASSVQELNPSEKYKQVKFKNTMKTVKRQTIKNRSYSFFIIKKSGGGKVSANLQGNAKNYLTVSSEGGVIVRRNTPKGLYKAHIFVSTRGGYAAGEKNLKVRVR